MDIWCRMECRIQAWLNSVGDKNDLPHRKGIQGQMFLESDLGVCEA